MKQFLISTQSLLQKTTDICRGKGYGIEVLPFSGPEYLRKTPDGIEIHRLAFRGIKLRTVHGPFSKLQPGCTDETMRKAAEKEVVFSLRRAEELDAGHLVVHHGEVLDTDPDEWVFNSIVFWKQILSTNTRNIRIHMENVRDADPALMMDIISGVDDERFDICLDIGHAHCYSDIETNEWITRLNNMIGYVHLHNNNGSGDGHLGIADGSMDIISVCNTLEKFCPDALWSLEVLDDYTNDSLVWLSEKGYIK